MAPLTSRPDATHSSRVLLEPIRDHHLLLDGSWSPGSDDLDRELRALLPVLDQIRGPVTRLLLSAAGWSTRPHHVQLADRTVSIGYLADQPPSMMTALCADGGTFILRVARPGRIVPSTLVPEC
jgi:hypothetical protein